MSKRAYLPGLASIALMALGTHLAPAARAQQGSTDPPALGGRQPWPADTREWPPPAARALPPAEPSAPPDWLREELSESGLTRLLVATMLVLAAGGLAAVWLRRVAGAGRGQAAGGGQGPVLLASLRLGPQMGLHWVEFQNQKAVVGFDRSGLKTICVLAEPFGSLVDSDETATASLPPTPPDPQEPWWQSERLT